MRIVLLYTILGFFLFSCQKDPVIVQYKTRHVIVVVVDGARYMETWGDAQHRFIPYRFARLSDAVVCTKMFNEGNTNTLTGHTAILTGNYQQIDNSGSQRPDFPSWLQHTRSAFGLPADQTWLIASKDKIEALADCVESSWSGQFLPMTDCGINGINTGYRDDSTTFAHAKNVLTTYHPRFVLINFREPDHSAHSGDSLGYLKGIRDTDSLAMALWNWIENDPFYAGQTTFIITNDHGRHSPDQGGFSGHGDNCEGCRHIEFFAISPDFNKNYISHQRYSQVDIAATIAEISGFGMEFARGNVMWDVLRTYERW